MAKPSYVANFIPALQAQGHSATSAARVLRDAGYSFADQTFRRLWGETVDHLSKVENVSHAPLNRVPTPDQIGVATRPKARGYLYNVEVAVHDPQTGEVAFHAWGVRTKKLVSIGAALRMAVDSWADSQTKGRGTPEGRALGGFISSVLNLVGPEETVGDVA